MENDIVLDDQLNNVLIPEDEIYLIKEAASELSNKKN